MIDLSLFMSSDGFTITGEAEYDMAGASVSYAGDVNGDGLADLIIGASVGFGEAAGPGSAFVVYGKTGETRTNIDLASLAATDGYRITGSANFDETGVSVAAAGDINGDGFQDLIVGAPGNDDTGDGAGKTYIIFGQAGATRSDIDLSSFDPADGFAIFGSGSYERLGTSVSSAGDINDDGFDDLIIGAPGLSPSDSPLGGAYVIFGASGALRADIDLAMLMPSDGFLIEGEPYSTGLSVSNAGDINGDGIDDVIIGAPYHFGGQFEPGGKSYVIFGQTGATRSSIDLGSLAPTDGFSVLGTAYDRSGFAVSDAGDVNGDGIDDLLISATNPESFAGPATYVIFGQLGETRSDIDLSSLAPNDGFAITGAVPQSVSGAGDFNSDGIDDLLIGDPGASDGPDRSGTTYVIFGQSGATRSDIDLSALVESDGVPIIGAGAYDMTGFSVSEAGDINGDGFDDLIVGAPGFLGYAGRSYVIFGLAPPNSAPTGLQLEPAAVQEGVTNGTIVGSLATNDPDFGDTFTYAITGGTGAGLFAVADDAIVVSGALDYETATEYTLDIQTTDQGGLSLMQQVTVTLLNVPPSAPVDEDGTANAVVESAFNGTGVGIAVLALDPAGGAVTYALSDDAGGRFAIDAASGVVTVANGALLDFESAGSHQITVTASDGSGATASQSFTIAVGNAPPATPVDVNGADNAVSEDAANGSLVNITAFSTDPGGDPVTYALSDDAGGRFAIDAASGVVTVANGALLDFESAGSHQITVTASDGAGATASQSFTIAVGNAPPATPVDVNGADNAVSEDAANGSLVNITAFSTDPGGGPVTYALSDDAGGRFAIDAASGVVTVANGALLDFESAGSHQITVTASDGAGATASQSFTIAVGNAPPATPVDVNGADNAVSEDAANGSLVNITAFSTDPGGDPVTYALSDDAGGRFAIDAASGVVTVANGALLDFESAGSHQITVTASDGAGATASQSFTIAVGNAPPATPVDVNGADNAVSEDAANGSLVNITAFSTDPGGGPVTYALSDDAGGRFAIDAASGVVTVANGALLDFESAGSHQITITASDGSGATASQSFTIAVGNAPPATPVDVNGADNAVSEDAANGSLVNITAFSTDPGGGPVTYALSDDAGGRFAIDAASGVVTVANGALLDFESAGSHQITVTASDGAGATASQSFTIAVGNAPPATPVDVNGADNAVSEDAANGSLVNITAFSTDPGGDPVTYALSDDAGGRFAIDAASGVVTVANGALLDFESAGSHQITVTASDGAGATASQSFTIAVGNAPPATPVDVNGADNAVSEDAANGSLVNITAFSTDPGGDPVTYALSDDAGGRFAIDAASGVVTVANGALLDFESAGSHQITVTASDGSGATASQSFTIAVGNAPPATPVDANGADNAVSEDAANGSLVNITAFSTDPGGDPVTYALSDDAGGRFAIDAASGVVTVANGALLDFESAGSHQITVTASDGSGATASQSFTIAVGNAPPAKPVDLNGFANVVSEAATTGAVVGLTIFSAEPGGGISYSLADDAGGRFAIDETSGVVTVADASLLDFESAASHQITVTASDGAGATAGQTFTIAVGNAGPGINLTDFAASDGFIIFDSAFGNGADLQIWPAGDRNADGCEDFVVASGEGRTFLLFGKPDALSGSIDLSDLGDSEGTEIPAESIPDKVFGDFNGDGLTDSAFTALADSLNFVQVLVDLGNDGQVDFALTSDQQNAPFSLSSADVNSDGMDDLIAGAPWARSGQSSDTGAVFVVFGKRGADRGDIELPSYKPAERFSSSDGFVIYNNLPEALGPVSGLGGSLSAAGDVNADGIADIVIGSSGLSATDVYVVFGTAGETREDVTLLALKSGAGESNGFAIPAPADAKGFGRQVSGLGDINCDGISDFAIGSGSGRIHVIFGKSSYETQVPLGFVNPLATLMQKLADLNLSPAWAEFLLETAFDIEGVLDLTPLELVDGQDANPFALTSQRASASLQIILDAVISASGDGDAALAVIADLLEQGTAFHLELTSTLNAILEGGLPGATPVLIDQILEHLQDALGDIAVAVDFAEVDAALNSTESAKTIMLSAFIANSPVRVEYPIEPNPDIDADSGNPTSSDFRLFASDGFAGSIGGSGAVIGTGGFQDIAVLDVAGTVSFDPSFNQGDDIVRLSGDAEDWYVSKSGSSAIFTDGDTFVQLAVGPAGMAVVFDDGARTLRLDVGGGGAFLIGDQVFTATLARVDAAPDGTVLPGGADAQASARLFLAEDGGASAAGKVNVIGTGGAEIATLLSGAITLDPSFNKGGDVIRVDEAAKDFLASKSGSSALLVGSDTTLLVPVGLAGATLAFGDGSDTRELFLSIEPNGITIDEQFFGVDPMRLMAAV